MNSTDQQRKISAPSSLEKFFFLAFTTLVSVLLVVFSGLLSTELVKSTLLVFIGMVSAVGVAFLLCFDRVELPKRWLLIGPLVILAVFVASAFISESPFSVSVSGFLFETGTVAATAALVAVFFAAAVLLRTSGRFMVLAVSLTTAALIAFVIQLADFFVPFLGGQAISGQWFTLPLFCGFFAILMLVFLDVLRIHGVLRWGTYGILAFSVLLQILVGSSLGWIVLGVYALCLVGASLAMSGTQKLSVSILPWSSLGVFVLAIFFAFPGNMLSDTLRVRDVIEVRPSFYTTLETLRGVSTEGMQSIFLGSGPGTFVQTWNLHKPIALNQTEFWNVDFGSAGGQLLTLTATTGVLGFLSILAFIVLLHVAALRFLLRERALKSRLLLAAFLPASFGWVWFLLYTPGTVTVVLTMLFSGATVGLLGSWGERKAVTLKGRRFVMGAVSLAVVAFLLWGGYGTVERAVSARIYQKGMQSYFAGDTVAATHSLERALDISEHELYHRSLSEIYQVRLDTFLRDTDPAAEGAQADFEALARPAISHGQRAVDLHPQNYLNYLTLGNVYTRLTALFILGAVENGKENYYEAAELSPQNPIPLYLVGRIAFISGDEGEAIGRVREALELKPDFVPALKLQSQLAETELSE